MKMQAYIDEIKLELSGDILHLELPDETIAKVVNKALREVQRYIDETRLMTIPYTPCIDLSGSEVSSVARIFRTEGYNGSNTALGSFSADPMYAQMWLTFSNAGTMYNLNDYVSNYAAYNTLLQTLNTTTTDLAFKQDKATHKLYINCVDRPQYITIEYVPVFKDVDEVKTEYWQDILLRLSVALTKVTLGRIRSRYTQNNALWSQDGDRMLEEGTTELTNLREILRVNSQVIYPID